jgi:DNA-binding transcriptional ArsR family regulator
MTKTLQTKKRILGLLKKRDMTISQLSSELGLSSATISQHMDELARMGSVEKLESEHFKKLKYYHATSNMNTAVAKYVLGALIVVVAIAAIYFISDYSAAVQKQASNTLSNASIQSNTVQASVTTQTSGVAGTSPIMVACPMINYDINGSISSSSGFSVYKVNGSAGQRYYDYVISPGTSGILYANESITLLSSAHEGTRQHYAYISTLNGTMSNNTGITISIKPENYTFANTTTRFSVAIAASATAPAGTYWLRIDGPCGGGIQQVLLTIGAAPYNGTVTIPVGIYG